VRAALRAGANGYVLKESVSSDLELAIRTSAAGSLFLSAEVAALVAPSVSQGSPAEMLSPREREVVQLVVEGLSTKQIASQLRTSPKTVEKQRRNAMRKLGAQNVASLVRAVSGRGA
jgi:DNA-binding NarL/FixJ family response regulator